MVRVVGRGADTQLDDPIILLNLYEVKNNAKMPLAAGTRFQGGVVTIAF
jgi:hypothetical protein